MRAEGKEKGGGNREERESETVKTGWGRKGKREGRKGRNGGERRQGKKEDWR